MTDFGLVAASASSSPSPVNERYPLQTPGASVLAAAQRRVTIHRTEAAFGTSPVLVVVPVPLSPDDTHGLH